jgi:hypothetical protein
MFLPVTLLVSAGGLLLQRCLEGQAQGHAARVLRIQLLLGPGPGEWHH